MTDGVNWPMGLYDPLPKVPSSEVHIGHLPNDRSEHLADVEATMNLPRGGARYHGEAIGKVGGPHDGMGSQPRSVTMCKRTLAKRAPPGAGSPWQGATYGAAGWKAMIDSSQTDPSVMHLIKTLKNRHGLGTSPPGPVRSPHRSPSRRKY